MKRALDFRKDDRCSGIPRNYFLCDGKEVYNIAKTLSTESSHGQKKINQSSEGNKTTDKRMNKLADSPDRAAALLFMNSSTSFKKKQIEKSGREPPSNSLALSDYQRFIIEGPRCTDGSFVLTTESHLSHHQRLLFPSQSSDQLVRHLQR
jgi:hypothetical protein